VLSDKGQTAKVTPEIRSTRRKITKDNTMYGMQLVQIPGLLQSLPHLKKNISELRSHLPNDIHARISINDLHQNQGMTFQVTFFSSSAMVISLGV
jgi:hypothetical protein